jgi:transposase InsO family protein
MKFWWKNLRKDVRSWVASCRTCATKKDPVVPVRAPLTSIAPLAKFQRWYTDCVGPLPLTEQGNKFFIIFVESITKYVEIFALPDLKAETTARTFVNGIVLRYGICKELYSDQGTNYTADLMRGIEDILGITPVFSSSFHPMSNGTAERTNRSIIQVMSQLVDTQKQKDWDLVIQYVAFALNTSISRTLKDSSHYLMYLADPVMPLDAVLDLPDERYYERDEYKVHMQILFSDAMESARTAIEASQDKQKIYYDQKAHPHPFQVGELVWLHCPAIKRGLVKKLCHLWHGPYRILDLDNVKALIRPVNNRSAKPKVVHVNRLKICTDDVVCEFRRKGEDYPANELNEEGQHNQPFRKRLKMDENAGAKRKRGPKVRAIEPEQELEPEQEVEEEMPAEPGVEQEPEETNAEEPEPEEEPEVSESGSEDGDENKENIPEMEVEEEIRDIVQHRYPLRNVQTRV